MDRWMAAEEVGCDFRSGRDRSRSTSRDRHRRRRSRSSSWDRPRGSHSRSPERGRHRGDRSRSRSRSRDRGGRRWRRHSRSPSPPGYYRRSVSPSAPHHQPPWHTGPGDAEVPPWHQQQHPYAPGAPPWRQSDGGLPPPSYRREGPQYVSSRWDNPMSRSRSRGSDSDRAWEQEERGRWPDTGPGPGMSEAATASVYIKGLPFDADESDLHAAFAAFPNIQSVKVLRDRATGRSKGAAFLDFASADDARVLMESEARYNTAVGGQLLFLDYSMGGGAGGQGPAGADWICDMCSAVNFARRLECYHCSTARPLNPRRVTADLSEPSNVLKVSGLEPNTSEEALYQALSSAGQSIVDMRVIKDKFTGTPRGFAFVELPTIAAAGSVMQHCQGMVLQGQVNPLKICYAKTKESVMGSAAPADGTSATAATGAAAAAGAAAAVADPHLQPNAAPSGPLGWKPKEFNPDGSVKEEQPQEQQQQQQQDVGSAAAAAAAGAAGPGPGSGGDPNGSAAAAAAAGVDAATIAAMSQAGFEYQAASGYWWDPKSGYFYDTKTQLYYHHSTNAWYQYNADTGQYTAVGGDQQQQQQGQAQQDAGSTVQGPQLQPPQQQKQASVAEKRRRAVIGGAAQYNPEGLLAAAALAEEREAEQRRIAAAKAARERQQQQQQQGKGAAKEASRLMQGKPGIGMLPGTGNVPAPPIPPPTAAVVAQGNLQGVVYRSKWSQQRAAQQAGQ